MAKRGAEALACRAPCQSWLPRAPMPKRPRSGFGRRVPRCAALLRHGGKKRKREEEEGEAAAVPSGKRPSGPAEERGRRALSPRRLEGAARTPPPQLTGVDVEAGEEGAEDRRTPQRPAQHEDDVWHYNSFQFWRSPLPVIDLTDILDLEKIDTVEARDSSSVGLSEMET